MKKKILLALILALGISASTSGHITEPIKPLDASLFTPVEIKPHIRLIKDSPDMFVETADTKGIAKPKRANSKAIAEPKPKNKPVRVAKNASKHKGIASWYCNYDDPNGDWSRCYKGVPDGPGSDYYAAVRRDLLFLRGKTIQACAQGKCINVKVIDCNCGEHANIIDLYADAFAALYGDIGYGRRPVRLYY